MVNEDVSGGGSVQECNGGRRSGVCWAVELLLWID